MTDAMRRTLAIIALLVFGAGSFAQRREFVGPPAPIEVKRLLIPADAIALAYADVLTFPPDVRILTRYVWLQEPSVAATKSVSATLNRISRNLSIIRPAVLHNGALLRVNLNDLATTKDELQEYVDTWELLRFEPKMNLLLTPNAQEIILKLPEEQQPLATIRNGDRFESAKLKDLTKKDVIRLNAGHLNPLTTLALQTETLSAAPVITRDYFEFRALASIQGKGPFKDIFGGLYLDFMGLRKFKDRFKAKTDLDGLLEYLQGQIVDNAENRIAIEHSGVTGERPRAVGFFPTRARGPLDGASYITITEDVEEEGIDFDQNAIATLDRRFFKPDAKEAIWVMKNGMLGYALFDGKDKLLDEANQNVVNDTTTPGPYTKRLQAASSCIRCHEAEGSSGFKPAKNDVLKLIGKGLDVFGDAKDPNRPIDETLKALSGQYKAQPDIFLRDARFGFQRAMTEATSAWEGPKVKPTDVVTLQAKEFERATNGYWYSLVTVPKALHELGFIVKPESLTPELLKRLLPPRVQEKTLGIIPADSRIDRIALGSSLTRAEWSLSHNFAQVRALEELARIRAIQKPKEIPKQ